MRDLVGGHSTSVEPSRDIRFRRSMAASLRILVVARYRDLCDAVATALRDAGEEAHCSTSVDDAVRRLQTEAFALAVIEAVPPNLTTHQAARDEATRRGVPWIALVTTHVPAGAAAVLRMPFDDAELVNAVRSAARRG
ncbi:MAG: hypothetical protein E6J63_13900 [Deltaproteobacteria bacterium]|nr:MAG: hypothetical protein E6J63_13900 [Deltaproteobacteria bacterium]